MTSMMKNGKRKEARALRTILSEGLDKLEADQIKVHEKKQQGFAPGVTPAFSNRQSGTGGNMAAAPYLDGMGRGSVSQSLHTGDTLGGNQLLDTVQNDPYAKKMLGRTMAHGLDPDDERAFVADAPKWPHVQVAAPIVGNMMIGAAQAATPAAVLSGHALNLVAGENRVGNGLVDYGDKANNFAKSVTKSADKFPLINEKGNPTRLSEAVDYGGKFMRGLTKNAIEYGTGTGLLNRGHDIYRQGRDAYRHTLEEEEANRAASGSGSREESKSLAYYAMVREVLAEALSSVPGDLLKRATRSSDDLPLTSITQDTVLEQGKPALKQGTRNWLDNKLETDEWHKDNF